MSKNLIVDGMNIAFRSHHIYDVKQGLKTSSGVPTGIVYGFVKRVLKWKRQYPEHKITVAWDCPTAKKERQKVFADYKSNRDRDFKEVESDKEGEEMIDIFTLQIEFLQNFLKSLNVDQVKAKGYEADDLIGTLARGPMQDDHNIILTSDRDMLQLVTWKTIQMTPEGKAYDPDKVAEDYGVRPEYLLTFRVFDGDSSDCLPGLPRFRKKVIARIVNDNDGSIESIYNSDIENLSDKETEKLAAFEDQAQINSQIMTLRTVDDYECIKGNWNKDEINGMCDLLEFKSLRAELLEANNPNQGFLRYTDESLLHSTD